MGVITINNDIPFAFSLWIHLYSSGELFVLSLYKRPLYALIGIHLFVFLLHHPFYLFCTYLLKLPNHCVVCIICFTFFAIKKIKNTNGVTFQPDRFSQGNLFGTAEILLASQLGLKPETTVESLWNL
jgi:hypothetical protein